MAFWSRRVRRLSSGQYLVRLPDDDRALLANLLRELREIVAGEPDGRTRRLNPPAYAHDAEADDEYQRLMRDDLTASRLDALDLTLANLEVKEVDEEALAAWVRSLNILRLVLGTMLDVSEETTVADLSDDEHERALYAVYEYLGGLQEEMIQALSG